MGLLFVLILCLLGLGVLSLVIGIPSLILALYLQKRKLIKVRLLAWFLAPSILIGCFGILFATENVLYSIITDEDVGTGDYASVNINDKYHLYWIDTPDWNIGTKESNEKIFCHIQEILVHNDTIVFTSEVNGYSQDSTYYVLTQLQEDKAQKLDSAKSTKVLWDKFATVHKYDHNKICTCDEYYWNERKYFFWGSIIINILLIVIAIKKYGRELLFKNSES